MQKRLTPEQQQKIVEVATKEFGRVGYHAANINEIATGAGVSVGVIYKYYADKRTLFDLCLGETLKYMNDALKGLVNWYLGEDKTNGTHCTEELLRFCITFSKEQKDRLRMCYLFTIGNEDAYDLKYTRQIEEKISKNLIQNVQIAQDKGMIREDIDPGYFAMFLYHMFMMVLFSDSNEYYRMRYDIYCKEDGVDREEKLAQQLAKFLQSAFEAKESVRE